MKQRMFTPEEDQAIIRMAANAVKVARMAQSLGRTRASVIRRMVKLRRDGSGPVALPRGVRGTPASMAVDWHYNGRAPLDPD